MKTKDIAARGAESTSKRDQAYEALRHLLILQQINAGERLREPEWANRLGVNRTALREAFARLEAEGFIERGATTGYLVPVMTPQDINEITQVRTALECAAIEQICCDDGMRDNYVQAISDACEVLRDACNHLEGMLENNYILAVYEADRRFHETLVKLSNNRRLIMMYQRTPLLTRMVRAHDITHAQWPKDGARALREHRAILAAIAKANAKLAIRLLRKHLSTITMPPDPYCNDSATGVSGAS